MIIDAPSLVRHMIKTRFLIKHPGCTKAEPGSPEERTWRKMTGTVRIQYVPAVWCLNPNTKKWYYQQGFFYSYIDYGATSAWPRQR